LSSRSAFLRAANPGDKPDSLSLDLAIPFPEAGRDPIELLQQAYDDWKLRQKGAGK
jgi:hypothetical protein